MAVDHVLTGRPSSVDFLEKARVVLELVRNELPPCCRQHDLRAER